MAYLSSKGRLISELSRGRTSSPHDDDFATAGSFDMRNDQIINSTIQIPDNTTQQQLPLHYNHFADQDPSEYGSEGSADMSIELGRGVKRGARDVQNDVSDNLIFNLGDDSQYEVTGTPPIRSRPSANTRKSTDTLRREASIRRATESAKQTRATSGAKHRTLSESIAQINAENENDNTQQSATATFHSRNTRFTRSRQASANEQPAPSRFTAPQSRNGTPQRHAVNNPTVQSATYTANSYVLPEMPNITELVSGAYKDGTPTFSRSTKPRSRFTSASYKPRLHEYAPVETITIPDEEKAIYASLMLLKDKVAELEMAKSEAQKRAEEYEGEIIDLRSQLQAERRRPDSALGSDDETRAQDKRRAEVMRLQAAAKAAQDRLDRSERRSSVSDIAVKRITKERDELVTQIGVAYFSNEELKTENDLIRAENEKLKTENAELKYDLEAIRRENQYLGAQLAETDSQPTGDARTWQQKQQEPELDSRTRKQMKSVQGAEAVSNADGGATSVRSRKEGKSSIGHERVARRTSSTLVERQPEGEQEEDIASRIAREVQRHRQDAIAAQAKKRGTHRGDTMRRSSAYSEQHQTQAGDQQVPYQQTPAHDERDISEEESTTQLEVPTYTRESQKAGRSIASEKAQAERDNTRDLTVLSEFGTEKMDSLRRMIEERRRQEHSKRNVSAPAKTQHDDTGRSAAFSVPRKSSLRDITAGFGETDTRRSSFEEIAKAAKTVRVQSPHASDDPTKQDSTEAGDVSMLSNTSRRRRRAASAEGMTSAFILPDITFHSNSHLPATASKSCVSHNAASCTVCHPSKEISIPAPIPVTDREVPQDVDLTSATIRPSQPPPLALATVIKQIEDEIAHLKMNHRSQSQRYHQHTPALSKRRRELIHTDMTRLLAQIERRSNQVYDLYDVLEGQKQAAEQAAQAGVAAPEAMGEEQLEETLMSIGIDPAELAGRVGRSAPASFGLGLDGARDEPSDGESVDLPWEGLSDYESEEEVATAAVGGNRRSVGF